MRRVGRKNGKTMAKEYSLVYRGPGFSDVDINPVPYCDDFFHAQLDLESDLFYELRKKNDITPYEINRSSSEELIKIKDFFNRNKKTFFFLFDKNELIGSILFLDNYIQALSINRKYQRSGYGTKLTKFAINWILSSGNPQVVLKVMEGNIPALELYKKLGFRIVE